MRQVLHKQQSPDARKCELASDVLRSSGTLRLQVTGWSMLPSLRPGDTLVVETAKSDAVCEGDIVLFGRSGRLLAHRVVERAGGSRLLTQGDALPAPDPPVSEQEFLGRVSAIVRNGKSITPCQSLGLSARALAALVRRSSIAARAVARLYVRHQDA